MSETDEAAPKPKWTRHSGYLLADIGSPDGRTVCNIWHDDVRVVDGEKETMSSNRECSPFKDPDEWDRKSADLDELLIAANAFQPVLEALELARKYVDDAAYELDAAGQHDECTKILADLDKIDTALELANTKSS